ncbi:MAG: hypothetical protein WBO17_08635 [Sphingorhabdus sp.]
MYSENDLQSAVEAGVLSREAADSLRRHADGLRQTPVADEEHFRLVTGFNDIFVTIAAIIMLFAVGGIGQSIHDVLAGLLVAVTAWGLAEFFTAKKRMALPSIVLLLAFVGGVLATQATLVEAVIGNDMSERFGAVIASIVALITAGAAWVHWRRFKVPITIAAGAAAIAGTVGALMIAVLNPPEAQVEETIMALVLIGGVAIFAFAMHWDISDRSRETRRSDVAFWLHLLAAPMIAHPLFWLFGVTDGNAIGAGAAIGVLCVYIAMGLVAIAVDRRALLVSALAYVLGALTFLFREYGVVELNVALTALIIGSALLCLSAFWSTIRHFVVERLPSNLKSKLPATHLATA